ncbi:MAG: 30S ribosomal protein S12 methylthiotransferase RimO [Verrucomicrobia bacterium]|nr:30S ribosomal protein S12 methylthiotransferase RimO [Verrucomicrobiota bacterium]
MISLGCAKNLVDAEVMLGGIRARGMEVTADATEADVLIVNTCAFIDSAKEESIEAILQAHQQRGLAKRGRRQKLVVSGCMSQRFSKELAAELPEVDAFLGLDQVAEAGEIVERLLQGDTGRGQPLDFVTRKSRYIPDYDTPRFRLTPSHYAFVKIAEGCNHPCSFCVIPQMRGRHRSRSIESVEAEVRSLVAERVKEFNLISQDTTYFGMDLWPEKAGPRQPVDSRRGPTLSRLIRKLDEIPGDFWVRLLYTHPAHWSEELIQTISQSPRVVPYVDMPLQHIDGGMLSAMRRETSREHIEDLIVRLRQGVAGLTLRTTFIVGFPGETDEQFETLLEFIGRTRFERLGVFLYSQEEGSRAARMQPQVPLATKKERYRRAMALQQRIAREMAGSKVGSRMRVLVDQPLVARSAGDAPEVDTRVLLDRPATVGEFAEVTITGAQVYDVRASVTRQQGGLPRA